jgi:arginine decarboxylase
MIEHTARRFTKRVVVVDDELTQDKTAGGRSVRALAAEMRIRDIEVVEAPSCEDGLAAVVSDAAIHCVFVNRTLGRNDRRTHEQATELLRDLRARNARVPVFLPADRKVAGTVSIVSPGSPRKSKARKRRTASTTSIA